MSEKCKIEACSHLSIYDSDLCWDHVRDKNSYKKMFTQKIGQGISFERTNLSGVNLSDLELAQINFTGANLAKTNLSNSNLFNATLKDAELLGADLSGCDLTGAELVGSDLTRSTLVGARLWHANLEGATLIEADLTHCDLWSAQLFNSRFWRTNLLHAISLEKKNFQSKSSRFSSDFRINEKGILSAEEAYRSFKKYFILNGRYDDASWASFKEKSMERHLLKQKDKLAYIPSMIMNLLCGYGEKPHRIILSSSFVILAYATLFFILKAISYMPIDSYKMSFGDYLYYSVITFTTVGYGDFIPKAVLPFRFLAASEAFIGAFMIGLFIFTLARKHSAR